MSNGSTGTNGSFQPGALVLYKGKRYIVNTNRGHSIHIWNPTDYGRTVGLDNSDLELTLQSQEISQCLVWNACGQPAPDSLTPWQWEKWYSLSGRTYFCEMLLADSPQDYVFEDEHWLQQVLGMVRGNQP